jgi:hypothetical protein
VVFVGLWVTAVLVILCFVAVGGGRVFHLWLQEPVGIAVPLLACIIVLAAPQMADMMAAMKTGYGPAGLDRNPIHEIGLGLGVLVLGLQSWFWTRAGLNARGGYRDRDAPVNLPWQEIWAPRLTLVPATLIAISPLLMGVERDMPWSSVPWVGVASALAASALAWFLAWQRRHHKARMGGTAVPRPLPCWRTSRLFAAAPFGAPAAWLMLLLAVLGMLIAAVAPELVGDHLHALTASLIALSCLVAVASVALALLRDLAELALGALQGLLAARPLPIGPAADLLGAVLLIALPVGGSYLADAAGLYNVRHIDNSLALVTSRQNVRTAAHSYVTACHPNETGKVPAIIVASEGGASRSAAWTLSIMRMLDARTGGAFGTHLFAVIGVSGGSLGAVTYALAQTSRFPREETAPQPATQVAFWDSAQVTDGMVELARADLLSPAIARLFTSDILLGMPRRGPALEQTFEHFWRWDEGFDLGERAGAGFLAMREGHPCLPHLILSGTDVDTGDRLLTSSIGFLPGPEARIPENSKILKPFAAAVDVLSVIGADIPASAAVLNSARFPIISPPGRIRPGSGSSEQRDLDVIDGGVFENYGARAAWELADAIGSAEPRLEPIVVLISNDVEIRAKDDLQTRCQAEPSAAELNRRALAALTRTGKSHSGVSAPEFLTSALGLYNTRGAHARSEIAVLERRLCGREPWHLFHFDLPEPDISKAQTAPMNWALDPNSCQFMLGIARRAPFNAQQATSLRDTMGSPAAQDTGDRAAEDSALCGGSAVPLPSDDAVAPTASNGH